MYVYIYIYVDGFLNQQSNQQNQCETTLKMLNK